MKCIKCIRLRSLVFLVASVGAFAAGTTINFASLDKKHPYKLSGRFTCQKTMRAHARPLSSFMGPWESTPAGRFIGSRS